MAADEDAADIAAVYYSVFAGYDPEGLVRYWATLSEKKESTVVYADKLF